MTKLTALDQMQRTLDFVRAYAEQNPDFRKALEAALAEPSGKKPKAMTPHEYVAEHGLPAFKEHVSSADMETVTAYARRLKIKVSRSKSGPTDDLRQSVVTMMESLLDKGTVFAQHG